MMCGTLWWFNSKELVYALEELIRAIKYQKDDMCDGSLYIEDVHKPWQISLSKGKRSSTYKYSNAQMGEKGSTCIHKL